MSCLRKILTTRDWPEPANIDPVLLNQLPECTAILLRDLRGARDVSTAGTEHALNVILLEPLDLLRLRFTQRLSLAR